ncbi:polyprenyl synthetase family protein [Draconibacterium sp. IB214405]|uniref:polyprenyl synthetase family protein n=1 Tax=Draconibacterium sp. IB214405 TaxID=3097352 RepID=UPI002A10DA68|nr:polyprenyl synthetase family protein [Draconibacterium sp. IB214405]MDX8337615.1 polyprenyl synthetase family protein [Draconibacterium sp. IB214405]
MYTIEELQKIVSTEVDLRSKELLKNQPVELYDPISYSLDMGGKRLRPVLVLLAYNMFAEAIERALPAAIGIEVFHNFTLLHDDIMDKADVRRNRPTVHKKFSENAAILSGDAMAFQSYRYFLEERSEALPEVLEVFSKTALEVCEGQQYDMDFEQRMDVTEAEYLEMIRLKTAVLLACSLKVGALIANAPATIANQLYDFGINLGLAFQLQDDLLDTFGDQAVFGKQIGGDILANKKTFLLINTLEKASEKDKALLVDWIEKTDFDPKEKISAVTELYQSVGVKNMAEEKVNDFFNRAILILDELKVQDVVKQPLRDLAHKMLTRKH